MMFVYYNKNIHEKLSCASVSLVMEIAGYGEAASIKPLDIHLNNYKYSYPVQFIIPTRHQLYAEGSF